MRRRTTFLSAFIQKFRNLHNIFGCIRLFYKIFGVLSELLFQFEEFALIRLQINLLYPAILQCGLVEHPVILFKDTFIYWSFFKFLEAPIHFRPLFVFILEFFTIFEKIVFGENSWGWAVSLGQDWTKRGGQSIKIQVYGAFLSHDFITLLFYY